MEENIVLKDQISIEEALKMVEETKEVQAIESDEFEDKYAIQNEIDVMYHLDRIREEEEKKKRKQDLQKIRIKQAKQWYVKECKEHDRLIELSKIRLIQYYKKQKEKDPRYKLSTPAGSVSCRKVPNYNYYDEEQVIKYLKENHSAALRVKEEIDKNEFRKIYKDGVDPETGEFIPGVEVGVVESFSIKTE